MLNKLIKVYMRKKLRKSNKLGFSLVELIVAIAMLVVLMAVFTPSFVTYIEQSRAQKDISAMNDLRDVITLSLTNEDCYNELLNYCTKNNISCYIDNSEESIYEKTITKEATSSSPLQYTFGDDTRSSDRFKYYGAGNMSGVTITFEPQAISKDDTMYYIKNAQINKFMSDESIKGKLEDCEEIYNFVKKIVQDNIDIVSRTYKCSEYTIFIAMEKETGSKINPQDSVQIYGQYNGKNMRILDSTPVTTTDRNIG